MDRTGNAQKQSAPLSLKVSVFSIQTTDKTDGGGAAGTFITAELHGELTWARNLYTKTVFVWPKR